MTYLKRPSFAKPVAPKCPAIILNNSGSMMAEGRLEKTASITSAIARDNNGVDFYVNDARTGIPDYVTHIDGDTWRYTQPFLPMMTGEDYFNTLALAAVISEYPAGIHIIDDGDDTGYSLWTSLHLLKSMKHPGYMHPVTVYFVRPMDDANGLVLRYSNELKQNLPSDEGFNVECYHAAPDHIYNLTPERTMKWPGMVHTSLDPESKLPTGIEKIE
ncbi:MAG: hypothetical protein CMA72_00775 [Euryarchaeota archaeon]|jgi:hypothetical protein|nr:hypothetical protein [Euryarchaeota archaeon]|tara:strand:- start:59 stop:706 length:648 start_codon:yes stop_codon:yes gene_type:complete